VDEDLKDTSVMLILKFKSGIQVQYQQKKGKTRVGLLVLALSISKIQVSYDSMQIISSP
jgi:hypothetical protein